MVDRRGVERFFARVWSDVKRDFGFAQRQPDFLDALDARLRLQGDHPGIIVIRLAASYVFIYFFLGTVEGQNLANLLLLGGVLHKLANRPRGVPVHWESFLAAAALPAFLLFSRSKFFEENEGLVSLVLPPLLFLLLLGWFIVKLATRPRGAEVDWEPLITLALLLFGAVVAPPQGAAPADEKVKAAYKACVNAAKEWCDTYEKCRDAWEACADASR